MQLHLILALNGQDSINSLANNIAKVYPTRHRLLGDKPAWLVADNQTASIVSEKLGINDGDSGISALVTTMANYFGRAEPELWSWIKIQLEAQSDGASNTPIAA